MSNHDRKTIDEVLDELLDEQEGRWSPVTFEKYATVIDLLESYLERYWPGHDSEQEKVTKAGRTFCSTYGVEDLATNFSMFLDYFMPHKVLASEGTSRAAPRVIKKLAKWLVAKGYDPNADYAVG
jgi:hypothetical protein